MRKTHLERLEEILNPKYNVLEAIFSNINMLDINKEKPVPENIIEEYFELNKCADIYGFTPEARSHKTQRKMDLAVSKQTYHLWKDQNYFDVSPLLIKKLRETVLTDINTYFLRTPFRSMYINLPKGNGYYITNNSTGKHEVNAIYLLSSTSDVSENVYIPRLDKKLYGITKQMNLLVWGEEKGNLGDTILFSDLIFKEGNISDSLELNKELLENPAIIPEVFEMFNFVVKLLLYINCSNASIKHMAGFNLEHKLSLLKNPGKKRKLLKRFDRESTKAHSYIDIRHTEEQGTYKSSSDSSNKRNKTLEYVRPHFKVQRYGEKRAESKIIWIDPYVRGEGSENFKTKKIYKVH